MFIFASEVIPMGGHLKEGYALLEDSLDAVLGTNTFLLDPEARRNYKNQLIARAREELPEEHHARIISKVMRAAHKFGEQDCAWGLAETGFLISHGAMDEIRTFLKDLPDWGLRESVGRVRFGCGYSVATAAWFTEQIRQNTPV